MDLQTEIDKKRAEIAELEKQLKESEAKLDVKPLDEYTLEEKVEVFDHIYRLSKELILQKIKDHYEDDDKDIWCFEAVLPVASGRVGDKFWKWWNKL